MLITYFPVSLGIFLIPFSLASQMIYTRKMFSQRKIRKLDQQTTTTMFHFQARNDREKMGWDKEYLHYTNEDNPYGDSNLTSTFRWQKKLEKDGIDKGQLISECLFGVIDFPKNQQKI